MRAVSARAHASAGTTKRQSTQRSETLTNSPRSIARARSEEVPSAPRFAHDFARIAIGPEAAGTERLNGQLQSRAEAALDVSLADVRVHSGPGAAAAASHYGARAFAFGRHIALGAGVATDELEACVRAGAQKRDGTPVLSATLTLGPDHAETELDALMARLRPPEQLVILRDMKVGMKGAEVERVEMGFDQHMGKLYPFSLADKLAVITEPCAYYTEKGGAESPWGRPIIPLEMISVLTQYTSGLARFPVRQPVVGLFANQEIRLLDGPLFVGEPYLLEREVIMLSESRRVESSWVRTSVREAKSERLVATMLLNGAVMKASYPNYEQERAALA